jgi:hypothetical protein
MDAVVVPSYMSEDRDQAFLEAVGDEDCHTIMTVVRPSLIYI